MGKGKYGKVMYFRQKQPPRKKTQPPAEADPARQLENMEPLQLTQGINNLLRALEKKGVKIADYDQKERRLYSIQQVKGKFYFLAARPEDTEERR